MTLASASRVTRSRRSLRLALLLFAAVLSAAGVLRAQEGGTPPAQPTPPDSTADAAATAQSEAGEAAPAAEPGRPRTPAAASDSPAHFEPTEKVRADFDVSFPIDI